MWWLFFLATSLQFATPQLYRGEKGYTAIAIIQLPVGTTDVPAALARDWVATSTDVKWLFATPNAIKTPNTVSLTMEGGTPFETALAVCAEACHIVNTVGTIGGCTHVEVETPACHGIVAGRPNVPLNPSDPSRTWCSLLKFRYAQSRLDGSNVFGVGTIPGTTTCLATLNVNGTGCAAGTTLVVVPPFATPFLRGSFPHTDNGVCQAILDAQVYAFLWFALQSGEGNPYPSLQTTLINSNTPSPGTQMCASFFAQSVVPGACYCDASSSSGNGPDCAPLVAGCAASALVAPGLAFTIIPGWPQPMVTGNDDQPEVLVGTLDTLDANASTPLIDGSWSAVWPANGWAGEAPVCAPGGCLSLTVTGPACTDEVCPGGSPFVARCGARPNMCTTVLANNCTCADISNTTNNVAPACTTCLSTHAAREDGTCAPFTTVCFFPPQAQQRAPWQAIPPCHGNGACITTDVGTAACVCNEGWAGAQCDTAIDNAVPAVPQTRLGFNAQNRSAALAAWQNPPPVVDVCVPTPVFYGRVSDTRSDIAESVCVAAQGRVLFETEVPPSSRFASWARDATYDMIRLPGEGMAGVWCMARLCTGNFFEAVSDPLATAWFLAPTPNAVWNPNPVGTLFAAVVPQQITSLAAAQQNTQLATTSCRTAFGSTAFGPQMRISTEAIGEVLLSNASDTTTVMETLQAGLAWTFAHAPNRTTDQLAAGGGVVTLTDTTGARTFFSTPSLVPVGDHTHRRMLSADVGTLFFLCAASDVPISLLAVDSREVPLAIVSVHG